MIPPFTIIFESVTTEQPDSDRPAFLHRKARLHGRYGLFSTLVPPFGSLLSASTSFCSIAVAFVAQSRGRRPIAAGQRRREVFKGGPRPGIR
jgi:hypothetical protein